MFNSAEYSPKSSEKDLKFFLKEFFGEIMGGGDKDDRNGDEDFEGPEGCKGKDECKNYCSDPDNRKECEEFAEMAEGGGNEKPFGPEGRMTGKVVWGKS